MSRLTLIPAPPPATVPAPVPPPIQAGGYCSVEIAKGWYCGKKLPCPVHG
jgi:hypothetical protein